MTELFQGLMKGQYPDLADRGAFWKLLVTVACRNALDEINRETAQRRGSGKVHNESEFTSHLSSETIFERVSSETKTPCVEAMVSENCAQLLELLSPINQAVVVLKMAGFTNREISAQLKLPSRTLDRNLPSIRKTWAKNRHS